MDNKIHGIHIRCQSYWNINSFFVDLLGNLDDIYLGDFGETVGHVLNEFFKGLLIEIDIFEVEMNSKLALIVPFISGDDVLSEEKGTKYLR